MTASPRSSIRSGQVLVAVDGSPASLAALRYGNRMAELLGAGLTAVTAWQPLRHGILPPASSHPFLAAEQMVTNSVLEAFHGSKIPEYETVAVEGDPAEGLIRLSSDAELLVVGSRGHSGLVGALLGSVSAACAARAHCPVTVVHAPAATTATHPVTEHQRASGSPDSVPASGPTDPVQASERIVVSF